MKGEYSANKDLPPNTINLGTRSFGLRGKIHSRGPNKHLPVFSPKMAVIHPNFPEENRGGGPHKFTDSFAREILEFS